MDLIDLVFLERPKGRGIRPVEIKTALGAHSADLQSADCLSQSQQAAEYAQSFLDQKSSVV